MSVRLPRDMCLHIVEELFVGAVNGFDCPLTERVQSLSVTSSREVELRASSQRVKESVWLRRLLRDLKLSKLSDP